MKKIIGIIICLSLILSIYTMPTYAISIGGEKANFVYINAQAATEIYSTMEFVEGREIQREYDFVYMENGDYVYEKETVRLVMIYIDIPLTNARVEAYHVLNDFSNKATNQLNATMNAEYPYAQFVSSADATYNCHSYAWYDSDPGNECWIDFPDLFYQSGIRFNEVDTPQVGDIICYYNSDGTNLHSGIVTSINGQSSNGRCGNSNTVNVTSKWGIYGVYTHNGYQCPYTTYAGYYDPVYTATYVRYFREHNHSMNYVNVTTYYQHRATCRTCGHSYLEPHNWQTTDNVFFSCRDCHIITDGPVVLESVSDDLMIAFNSTVGSGDGAMAYNDNTIICRVNGEYYLVKGVAVEQAVALVLNNTLFVE